MADETNELPARPIPGEVAATGQSIHGLLQPYIGELSPHPREFQRYRSSWQDDYAIFEYYRRSLADEQVYSTLNQRLDAAIAVPWEVRPGGTMLRDRRAADLLREDLEALDFNRISRQMLYGVYFGYAVGEAIWAPGSDRVRLADIKVRAPDRFRWDEDNKMMLRTFDNAHGTPIPPAKFWLLARPGEHGDTPHGPGLARWCYWPAWMRRNGLRFWAIILERFGSPIPIGTYPKNDIASRTALLDVLRGFAAGAGVALPEGQSIDMLHAMTNSGTNHGDFAGYMDSMIAKVLLGQSSTTEQGPWRGTAEVQKSVRDEVIIADCNLLDESIRSSIATWWTGWNFPGAAVPEVIRDASPPEDLDARSQREERIARMSGLRPTPQHIRDIYGGDWMEAPAPAPPADPDMPPEPETDPAMDLAGPDARDDPITAAIAARLDGDGWEPYLEPILAPILAAAGEDGMTLEALRDRLGATFAAMDADELVETLRRMMLSTQMSGATPDDA